MISMSRSSTLAPSTSSSVYSQDPSVADEGQLMNNNKSMTPKAINGHTIKLSASSNSNSPVSPPPSLGYNPAQHPLVSPPHIPSKSRKLSKSRPDGVSMVPSVNGAPPVYSQQHPPSTPPAPDSTSSHGHGSNGSAHGHGHPSGIRVHQNSNGHRTIVKARPTTPQKGMMHTKTPSMALLNGGGGGGGEDSPTTPTPTPDKVDEDTMRNAGIPL